MSDSMLVEEEVTAVEAISVEASAEEPAEVRLEESTVAEVAVSPPASAALDQRSAVLAAVQTARELPPGVRERLQTLVQSAVTLDVAGEPLLATRQVLDLLAQGLPPVLRHEAAAEIVRPHHPDGDAFFALAGEDLSDQQAEQIARQQLQRAGMLRSV
ncbi:hypothetical protein [Anatilimnocola floriformis]|uniref:hypothetical protein n=1 Tax=Anatilimnocola floriformis TaxID=2948575 RepID=UPI0020C1E859|nr:hypothetical protein [Anatilimnocola floriformis]